MNEFYAIHAAAIKTREGAPSLADMLAAGVALNTCAAVAGKLAEVDLYVEFTLALAEGKPTAAGSLGGGKFAVIAGDKAREEANRALRRARRSVARAWRLARGGGWRPTGAPPCPRGCLCQSCNYERAAAEFARQGVGDD